MAKIRKLDGRRHPVDDTLPPMTVIDFGSKVSCCGCIVLKSGPPPDPACGCRCHDECRWAFRLPRVS